MESPSSGSEHTRSLALVLLSGLAARCLLRAPRPHGLRGSGEALYAHLALANWG